MGAIVQAGVAGLLTGSLYALIGVSITLMFRSTGVLSFAHAAFATFAAFVYSGLTDWGWPVALAALVAVGVAVVGALFVERVVIRPVAQAAPLTRLIVTLGVLLASQGLILAIFGFDPRSAPHLFPPRTIRIAGVIVVYQQVAIFVLALAFAVGLGVVLQRTRMGLAVRAAAQDLGVARLLGVRPRTVAVFNWGLAGVLSGVAGVLAVPFLGATGATFPVLLVKSLAGTLFGGLVSIPATFLGSLGVGAAESIAQIYSKQPGTKELTVLGIVVLLLLLRRNWPAEFVEEAGFVPRRRVASDVPGQLGTLLVGGLVALFLALSLFSPFWAFTTSLAAVYAMVGLALVILTGWAGQPSLMHAAFLGLGAFSTFVLVARYGLPLPPSLLLGALAGMVLGGLVSLPALRLRGLQLAVVTLAVAGAVGEWLVQLRTINLVLRRPTVAGVSLADDKVMALIIVPIAGLAFLGARNLRRSSWGAVLVATRYRQDAVGQFGVSPTRVKLAAFLLSGFIAALAGGLWGILLTRFGSPEVGINASIRVLLIMVVGGIGSLAGPLIGVLAFIVVPQLIPSYAAAIPDVLVTAIPDILVGTLVILTMARFPAGQASALRPLHLPFDVRPPRWNAVPMPWRRLLPTRATAEVGSAGS